MKFLHFLVGRTVPGEPQSGSDCVIRRLSGNASPYLRTAQRVVPATLLAFSSFAMLLAGFTASAATIEVRVDDYFFDPPALVINTGDTVVWRSYGGEHTATSDIGLFDSDILPVGGTFSYTFSETGDFPYHCSIHGGNGTGMSGNITVAEPGEDAPPFTPINISPADLATNQAVAVRLRANSFSDPDTIDFHAASQWILRDANNGAVALDTGEVTGNGSLTNYSPTGLLEGTAYDWQVRYKDERGAWSEYSLPTRFTTLVSFKQQGTGLRGGYSNGGNLDAPLVVLTNAVDFDWGMVRPHRRITADSFAVRWEGSLLPQFTESYQIQFQYRGRARVWINNQLLIDEWNGCGFSQTRRGEVPLVAGLLAAVRVDYLADPAGAMAILRWTSPSLPIEPVPASRLFPF